MKANLKLMAEGALWKVSCSGATLRAHDAQTATAMCRTLQTRGEPIPGKTYRHFTLQSELIAGLSCARFVAHKMRRLSVVCKRILECAPSFPNSLKSPPIRGFTPRSHVRFGPFFKNLNANHL